MANDAGASVCTPVPMINGLFNKHQSAKLRAADAPARTLRSDRQRAAPLNYQEEEHKRETRPHGD